MTEIEQIGELILLELPRFAKIFAKNFSSKSIKDLKYQSLMIMWILYKEGKKRPKEIAEMFKMSKGNVKYHLDKLESKGYVKIERLNQRKHLVSLTKKGKQLMDFGVKEAKEKIIAVLYEIPKDYLHDVKRVLERIKELNDKLMEVKNG